MDNKVAKIIKYYSYVNAAISLVLALILSYPQAANYCGVNIVTFLIVIGCGIVSSIVIYAVGEIVDLLQAIKNNTSNGGIDSTLPPL